MIDSCFLYHTLSSYLKYILYSIHIFNKVRGAFCLIGIAKQFPIRQKETAAGKTFTCFSHSCPFFLYIESIRCRVIHIIEVLHIIGGVIHGCGWQTITFHWRVTLTVISS